MMALVLDFAFNEKGPQSITGIGARADLECWSGYTRIWHSGKWLIKYQTMKELRKPAVRMRTTRIDTLNTYLKTHKAVLAVPSPA